MSKSNEKRVPNSRKKSANSESPNSSTVVSQDIPTENEEKNLQVAHVQPRQIKVSGSRMKNARRSYTGRAIIPAEKPELISVAEAMHREKFGERLKTLFAPETDAAIKAMESGIYIGWRCAEFTWDCIRVGEISLCFCGHKLKDHKPYTGPKSRVPCESNGCKCRSFAFIPSRPEDVGEFWLQRRPGYDASTWKAKCRCKHPHTEHLPTGSHRCAFRGCRCMQFESNFLCAACDRHWEEHETYFETEKTRAEKGLPRGEDYIPFAEMAHLRNMALTGSGSDSSAYKQITGGVEEPSTSRAITADNSTPVPFGKAKTKKSSFNPVYD